MSIVGSVSRGLECIQRFVNYKILKDGSYRKLDGGDLSVVVTVNKYLKLDKEFHIIAEKLLPPREFDEYISGLEDFKLYKCKNGEY